ncbi:hypothetical protein WH96_07110 [Kiloniella spongiae]|uniref:Uncharacterized protein n=1 Tax=Kiloniella spongiae TaxID=1489064 RepID=A0A0H2MFX3_9PROT|nr:hypothetical protein WH96_07110 [Kiloniella spongiae]
MSFKGFCKCSGIIAIFCFVILVANSIFMFATVSGEKNDFFSGLKIKKKKLKLFQTSFLL